MANLKFYFNNEVTDYVEIIDPISGYPVRVEHYQLRQIVHADVDTNGDHVLDQRIKYSPLFDILSAENLTADK